MVVSGPMTDRRYPDNPLSVLYEDAALLVVHKPAGLLVHRSPIDRHETEFALQYARTLNGGRHVYPVHRLDRPTSGVLVFARDRDVARQLGLDMMDGQVDKTYHAIVRGWPAASGVVDHPLREEPEDRRLKGQEQPVREALTEFVTLAKTELAVAIETYPTSRYALVRLHPKTGRKHQLRRHMKHISHPIIGDANHGRGRHNRYFAQRFGQGRLLLAATRIRFNHPLTGRPLTIDAPLEESFRQVLEIFPEPGSLLATNAAEPEISPMP